MSDVRKWYIGVYGGEAQARTCSPDPNEVIRDCEGDTFVLSRDHMTRESELKEGIAKHWQVVCDQRTKIDALQQRLTAADERVDDLSSAATKALDALRSLLKVNACGVRYAAAQVACHQLSAALKSGNS